MIPKPQLPVYWLWMYYVSFMHYPLEALVSNELHSLSFHCDSDEAVPIPIPDAGTFKEYCPVSFLFLFIFMSLILTLGR